MSDQAGSQSGGCVELCGVHFDANNRATCNLPADHKENTHTDGYYLWDDDEANRPGKLRRWWAARTGRPSEPPEPEADPDTKSFY